MRLARDSTGSSAKRGLSICFSTSISLGIISDLTDGYTYVRMVSFYAEFVKYDGIYGQGALNHALLLFDFVLA